MADQLLDGPINPSEVKKSVGDRFHTEFDPVEVEKRAELAIDAHEAKKSEPDYDGEDELDDEYQTPLTRAMTLGEFNNGYLLQISVSDMYKSFAIDTLRKIITENQCSSTVEKATAEVATLALVKIQETQRRMKNIYEEGYGEFELKALALLGKELDRANRNFFTAIQSLRMLKQPTLSVILKANTAIVGHNQVIQEEQNVKPI